MSSQIKNPGTGAFVTRLGSTMTATKGSDANILASDNVYTTFQFISANNARDSHVVLSDLSPFSISGLSLDRSTTTNYPSGLIDVNEDHGGTTDTWGLTQPIPQYINPNTFGCYLSVGEHNGKAEVQYSNYIFASNYGFTIPSSATINGIVAGIERKSTYALRTNTTSVTIDVIILTIYYTERFYPQSRMFQWLTPLLASGFITSIFSFLGIIKQCSQTRSAQNLQTI